MHNELNKLAVLEALGTEGRPLPPLWFLATRGPLPAGTRLDKTAARDLARRAAEGDSKAQRAVAAGTQPFIARTLAMLASRRKLEKNSQFMELAKSIDMVPAFSGVSNTDSILDAALQFEQRRNYMNYAVKKHLLGKKVLPPVWWGGTKDEWRTKLDTEAKKQMLSDIF